MAGRLKIYNNATSEWEYIGGYGKTMPAGDVVGTSDTQTLTNKTLTSPKINEDVALTATATELNTLDNSVPRKCIITGGTGGANFTAGSTQYVGLSSISVADYRIAIPAAGTAKNLYVWSGNAPGSGKDIVCTLMENGSATALTCTISGAASNSASDTAHTEAIAGGSRISLKIVTTAGATVGDIVWAIELDLA